MDDFNTTRDSLDAWVTKWEKAQQDGIFKDAPKGKSPYTPQTFFPPVEEEEDAPNPDDVDSAYWASTPKDGYVDPLDNKLLHEAVAKVKEGHGKAGGPMNPQPFYAAGKDQEYNAAMFDVKEFEALEKAKVQLHELEDQIATLVSGKDLQSKVVDLKKKIDELSNVLTYYSDTQTA